jgi:hypothetical protein
MLLASAAAAGLCALFVLALFACSAPARGSTRPRQPDPAPPWWSAASELARGCSLTGPPLIAFPSEAPSDPTGPGAIVWLDDPAGCGANARAGASATVTLAALTRREHPLTPTSSSLPGTLSGQLGAIGATFGRVALAAGTRAAADGGGQAVLLQARAGDGLHAASPLVAPGQPFSLTRAYLGDAALVTVQPGAIAVRVERHYASSFAPARLIPIGPGPVTSLVATMDFRGDVLTAWQQGGAIYAHMLRASGRVDPTQRVGASAPDPQLQALVSDNDHGMLAWASSQAHGSAPARTRVYIDLSDAGVRFRAPRTVASFADPGWMGTRSGSLELVRLSTENVLLAWTSFEHGRYVVRAEAAVYAGRRPSALLSDPHRQSVLAALATGPAAEAVAMWSSTARAGAEPGAARPQLWTKRLYLEHHDRVASRAAELIASPGAGAEASLAVDPANDRALAAWLTPSPRPRIEFVVSRGAAGYRPHALPGGAPGPPGAGVHWLRITLAAALGLLVLAALVLALRRRARRRQPVAR